MKWIGIFFLFAQAAAAEFSAAVSIPHQQATLFESIPLQLTLKYPKGYQIDSSLLQNLLLQEGGLGVAPFRISQVLRDQKEHEGQITDQLTFVLEPQTLGKKTLSFWKIPLKPPAGEQEGFLYPNWVEVEITAPKDLTKEPLIAPLMTLTERFPVGLNAETRYALADLEKKEPERNQKIFSQRSFAWLGWIALALGGLFLWRFRNPKAKDDRQEKKRSARMKLKESLNKLQKDIQEGKLEDFYAHLATHLRIFYEEFYGKRINALTTEEFLKEASPAMRKTLQEILFAGDQVRFGHLPSNPENAQKALDIAFKHLTFSG